jgi:nicotinamidase-related amidase
MTRCLIVIDVQESFRHRPYFSETQVNAYLQAQNALIAQSQQRGEPIVRVLHVEGPPFKSNPFALESGYVTPMQGLADFDAALTVTKSRHSALVGTGLDVWLTQQGIQEVIISGIRTEQCCETTARHASDLGWKVTYVLDATHTFDMQQLDGSPLPASDIKARTAAVLHGRFAQVCNVADFVDAP